MKKSSDTNGFQRLDDEVELLNLVSEYTDGIDHSLVDIDLTENVTKEKVEVISISQPQPLSVPSKQARIPLSLNRQVSPPHDNNNDQNNDNNNTDNNDSNTNQLEPQLAPHHPYIFPYRPITCCGTTCLNVEWILYSMCAVKVFILIWLIIIQAYLLIILYWFVCCSLFYGVTMKNIGSIQVSYWSSVINIAVQFIVHLIWIVWHYQHSGAGYGTLFLCYSVSFVAFLIVCTMIIKDYLTYLVLASSNNSAMNEISNEVP